MSYQLRVDLDEPEVQGQYLDEYRGRVGHLRHHLVYLEQKVSLKVSPVLWGLSAQPKQL